MSNYYHRDKEGNWYVEKGKELYSVEFSGSMEIAYVMGKIATFKELRSGINENLMLARNTQMGEMGTAFTVWE